MGPLCGLRLGQNVSLTLNNNLRIFPTEAAVAYPAKNKMALTALKTLMVIDSW